MGLCRCAHIELQASTFIKSVDAFCCLSMPLLRGGSQSHRQQVDQYGDNNHQREQSVDFRGNLAPCHAVNLDGQRGIAGAGHKVTDDHIVQRQGDGEQSTGDNAGHQHGDGHSPESTELVGAEIHSCLFDGFVETGNPRPQCDDYKGNTECHVGDHQRPETESDIQRREGGEGGDAYDKLRDDNGYIEHIVQSFFEFEVIAVHADGGEGAEHHGNDRADKRQFQRQKQGAHKRPVPEHGTVPVQGKSFKDKIIVVCVEGIADHHKDRQI